MPEEVQLLIALIRNCVKLNRLNVTGKTYTCSVKSAAQPICDKHARIKSKHFYLFMVLSPFHTTQTDRWSDTTIEIGKPDASLRIFPRR